MPMPSHQPTDESRKQVETMAGMGMRQDVISRIIGIDAKTLRKHYSHELDIGAEKANMLVAKSLFDKAVGNGANAVTAAIFWLKARASWKETADVNHTHTVVLEDARESVRSKLISLKQNDERDTSVH